MSANGCAIWVPTAAAAPGGRDDAPGQGLAGTAAMMPTRQMLFWALAIAAFALLLWLLRDILLPFVAGMAIAYLFDPLAHRLEQLGVRRLIAAVLIVGIFALALLLLGILIVPILGGQLSPLLARLPDYVATVPALVTDPNRPWLSKILGEGFLDAHQPTGELVNQGVGWLAAFLSSLWAGGRALVSIVSLLVVTPVVAFYFLYHWPPMGAAGGRSGAPPQPKQNLALRRGINSAVPRL